MTTDISIINNILFSLPRTLGLKQNAPVGITFSCSNIHDVTNSVTEIRQARVQLLEWQIMQVGQQVWMWGKQLHKLASHPALSELQGFS